MTGAGHTFSEIEPIFDEAAFPQNFLEAYDQLECLAHSHGVETFVVSDKIDSTLYIAKCYDKEIYPSVGEHEILRSLQHEGIPCWKATFEDDHTICIVREYVQGVPLDRYMEQVVLSEKLVIDLCVRLCDILTYLHLREPPVIHRDIKPQNVIVKEDGGVALIDFDISRTYDSTATSDTRFVGTWMYAPPEQYGFSQTDGRTDIYSLGVLLCWMLTNETDVKKAKILNKRLESIVQKCTAFSPEERFFTAFSVKKALLNADAHNRKRIIRFCLGAALMLLCLCAGFGLGRYTDLFLIPISAKDMQFQEPLIEQAVRLQLGKGMEETITPEELEAVKGIYIFGDAVALSREPFADGLTSERARIPRGDIRMLADVSLLPSLEELLVNYQEFVSIEPLSGARDLVTLDIRHTRVSDVSPLANMSALQSLNLYDTNVTDVTILDTCPRLKYLDLGDTLIRSPEDIGGRASLVFLSLKRLSLDNLNGLEAFSHVETLEMQGTIVSNLSPLLNMPALRFVVLDEAMRERMEAIADKASFTVTYE